MFRSFVSSITVHAATMVCIHACDVTSKPDSANFRSWSRSWSWCWTDIMSGIPRLSDRDDRHGGGTTDNHSSNEAHHACDDEILLRLLFCRTDKIRYLSI